MPSTNDIRRTITDPTPLYFAAGVIEKVRTEAPERIAKVRAADPKVVQEKFQGVLSTLDSDIKKLREQAQHLALQSIGYAAEAAVKAKEGYDSLAEQGKSVVETWRAKEDEGSGTGYETTIEREPGTMAKPSGKSAAESAETLAGKEEVEAEKKASEKDEAKSADAGAKQTEGTTKAPGQRKPAAKKASSRKAATEPEA